MGESSVHDTGKTPYRVAIRDWPEGERPREKLARHGAEFLSDAELLAILINAGSGARSALDVARELLSRYRTVRELARRSFGEMTAIAGIGAARAAAVTAAFELGRRNAATEDTGEDRITGPEDVARRYGPRMRDLATERFVVLLLDNAGRITREHIVSEGMVNASLVHPREVFKAAVVELATAIILLHNHPSGIRQASREDHAITRQIADAGRIMDIPVRDHVIICGAGYLSFAENGWL